MEEGNIAIRLKLFMDHKGMSNSQFADGAGIPRPSLSQLLNGRNKKISDILIRQIHSAYPELSIAWLLFGEGDMLDADAHTQKNERENPEIADDESGFDLNGEEMGLELADFGGQSPVVHNIKGRNNLFKNIDKIDKKVQSPRKVIRITVYYDDSSYETFEPAPKN